MLAKGSPEQDWAQCQPLGPAVSHDQQARLVVTACLHQMHIVNIALGSKLNRFGDPRPTWTTSVTNHDGLRLST